MLDQWFFTVFTYFTLRSNKITRFSPIHSVVLIYWKSQSKKPLQVGMVYINLLLLQFMFQYTSFFGRWNLTSRVNLPQEKNHCSR